MFNLKPSDPLDSLITEAETIITERARLLETIATVEGRLAEAQVELAAARECISAEEFENAQREDGVAIASKAAQQAAAEAELKVKSASLRLQGLSSQREKIEAALGSAWERIETFREDVVRQNVSAVSEQFDAAIQSFATLLFKLVALRHHAGVASRDRFGFHQAALNQIAVFNPLARTGWLIINGLFRDQDKKTCSFEDWASDPGASKLDQMLQDIKDRIAPIGALAAEVGPK